MANPDVKSMGPKSAAVTDPHAAPFIFFDGAPGWHIIDGTVRVTLIALRNLSDADGNGEVDMVAVAHLRASLSAARDLRDKLNAALLAAEPGPTGAAH